MASLFKAVKRAPRGSGKKADEGKTSSHLHEKLEENWTDTKEPVTDGITFYVKFIGSTLVEEILEEGRSYGDRISGNAVSTILNMARLAGRKEARVALTISTRGIHTLDLDTNQLTLTHCIYRICFCTADKLHEKVFAYIARNHDNETIECYAFLCPKKKVAQAITLTVAQTFHLAKEEEAKDRDADQDSLCKAVESIDLEKHEGGLNGEASEESTLPVESLCSLKQSESRLQLLQQQDVSERDDDLFKCDDPFSSLAASRHTKDKRAMQHMFSSGDDQVFKLFPGKRSAGEYTRMPSIDDLLCL